MFPYNRLEIIFRYIHDHTFANGKTLAELTDVSQRTIRSDIVLINEILKPYGAFVENERRKGYYLQIHDETLFNEFLVKASEIKTTNFSDIQQRTLFLVTKLVSSHDWIVLDDLANDIYIGKITLINNIKEISSLCEKHNLYIESKGNKKVRLVGLEQDKRKFILSELSQYNQSNFSYALTKQEETFFKDLDVNKIEGLINAFLSDNKIAASDDNRHSLLLHLCLSILRIKNDFSIESASNVLIDPAINQLFTPFFNNLEKEFDCTINLNERYYISTRFIANSNIHLHPLDYQTVTSLVDKTIALIYKYYSFDLSSDEQLKTDLFHHYYSILSSNRFQINKRNPLLYTLKTNFALSFDITLTTVSEAFSSIDIHLSEDEVGYISLHIGAAIERCFSGKITSKKIYLVCGNGQAMFRMLEARLHSYFREKIQIVQMYTVQEYEHLSKSDFECIDFIITTAPITNDYVPVVLIDFTLKRNDVESITFQINKLSTKKYSSVKGYFQPELFLQFDSQINKQDLLKQMCDTLQNSGYVHEKFYESILKREELSSTAMNNVFALPHPMYLQSEKSCIGVAIMKHPVEWGKENVVQIVFMLALNKNDSPEFEYLYDLIIQIINDKELQNEIIKVKDYDEFIEVITKTFKNLKQPITNF